MNTTACGSKSAILLKRDTELQASAVLLPGTCWLDTLVGWQNFNNEKKTVSLRVLVYGTYFRLASLATTAVGVPKMFLLHGPPWERPRMPRRNELIVRCEVGQRRTPYSIRGKLFSFLFSLVRSSSWNTSQYAKLIKKKKLLRRQKQFLSV